MGERKTREGEGRRGEGGGGGGGGGRGGEQQINILYFTHCIHVNVLLIYFSNLLKLKFLTQYIHHILH